jgi:excisionase family DNA binding protein
MTPRPKRVGCSDCGRFGVALRIVLLIATFLMAQSPPGRGRRYATKAVAAEYMGVSVRTVTAMLDDGRLRRYRFGKQTVRVDLNEVDALAGGAK